MINDSVMSVQLDSENPWPGLEPFEESAHSFFFGRDGEAAVLLRSVLDAPITVLYGRSGRGKTSLLRAGLFPALRARGLLPIYIRLDFKASAPPIADQLRSSIREAIEAETPDARLPSNGESVWEYLHRTDLELWNTRNFLVTPVIVIDQFEELFTVGQQAPDRVQQFRNDFGDLVENRLPGDVVLRLERQPESTTAMALRSRNYKILISLREDFLPDLEGWQQLIPSLGRTRLRLLPLSTGAALEAVYKPAGRIMTRAQAERVVRFIAGETDRTVDAGSRDDDVRTLTIPAEPEVEPALLSLFCQELNLERMRHRLAEFDDQLIEGAKRDVLQNYYERCIEGLPIKVARFVEDDLITRRGFRNTYDREDALSGHITEDQLSKLIDSRLIRIEERYGTQRIELSHDVLTSVIRARRDQREATERAEEAKKRAEAAENRRKAADEREAELALKQLKSEQAKWRLRGWPYLLISLLLVIPVMAATVILVPILSSRAFEVESESASLLAAVVSAAILALPGFPLRYCHFWFSFSRTGTTVGLVLYLIFAGGGGGLFGWSIATIIHAQATSSSLVNGVLYGIGGASALRVDFGSQLRSPTDKGGQLAVARSMLSANVNWVARLLDDITNRRAERWLSSLRDDQLASEALRLSSLIARSLDSGKAKKVMFARLVQAMEMLNEPGKRAVGRADLITLSARYYSEEHLPRPASAKPARPAAF